jgi:glutamate-ammonia-ligase adenylyltransferase
MSDALARFQEAVGSAGLAERIPVVGEAFLARRGDDAATRALEGASLLGVARVLATSAEGARLLAARPALLERIVAAGKAPVEALRARAEHPDVAGRDRTGAAPEPDDLEEFLDQLRLLRREETLFAACLDLGDAVPFAEVSLFLSRLAESILARALAWAESASGVAPDGAGVLSVIGMGKIGGREFTYHSDLDLLFLHAGGPEAITRVSRIGQRLVAYLTTMTRAGIAYAVDTRLRPSGNQGLLVTSFDAYARYQHEDAQLWEHLVLMRARAVAGDVVRAGATLERARNVVLREAGSPWGEVARMRARVERERADEGAGLVAYKTGAGGLMDVDFLAAGARLERGAYSASPAFPGNEALLRSVASGPRIDSLLESYAFLRRLEARNRWVAGRAVESLDPRGEHAAALEALAGQGEPLAALLGRIAETRAHVRACFRAVIEAESIATLDEGS